MCFITNGIYVRVCHRRLPFIKKNPHTHIIFVLHTVAVGLPIYKHTQVVVGQKCDASLLKTLSRERAVFFSRFFSSYIFGSERCYSAPYTRVCSVRAYVRIISWLTAELLYVYTSHVTRLHARVEKEKKKNCFYAVTRNTISTSRFRINRKRRCASRVCDIVGYFSSSRSHIYY